VHRLLEQQVAGSSEHPVTELAGCDLAQRHIINASDVARPPEFAMLHQSAQAYESRMVNEILVDAENNGSRLSLADKRGASIVSASGFSGSTGFPAVIRAAATAA
jgi:hypothetical protein